MWAVCDMCSVFFVIGVSLILCGRCCGRRCSTLFVKRFDNQRLTNITGTHLALTSKIIRMCCQPTVCLGNHLIRGGEYDRVDYASMCEMAVCAPVYRASSHTHTIRTHNQKNFHTFSHMNNTITSLTPKRAHRLVKFDL
jgi:hypothetical protein